MVKNILLALLAAFAVALILAPHGFIELIIVFWVFTGDILAFFKFFLQ